MAVAVAGDDEIAAFHVQIIESAVQAIDGLELVSRNGSASPFANEGKGLHPAGNAPVTAPVGFAYAEPGEFDAL